MFLDYSVIGNFFGLPKIERSYKHEFKSTEHLIQRLNHTLTIELSAN